jgi:hypothetical protein
MEFVETMLSGFAMDIVEIFFVKHSPRSHSLQSSNQVPKFNKVLFQPDSLNPLVVPPVLSRDLSLQ